MKQTRKMWPVVAVFMILALLVATGCSTTSAPTSPAATPSTGGSQPAAGSQAPAEPIKVGVVTSRTGPLAPTGVGVAAGVEFAAKEWNAKGGVGGRQIQVVVEDDRSTPTDALNAFNKLIAETKPIAVWGPTFTPLALAMEPSVVEAKIPVFASPTAPVVTKMGDGWFFRTRTNDAKTGLITAKFAVEGLKAQKVAFIYPNNDFGKGGYAIMGPALQQFGGTEVAAQVYNQGDKDITAQLLGVRQAGADLLIPWTVPTDSALLIQQAHELNLGVPILGGPGYATEEYLQLVGDATSGHYAMADAAIASREVGGRPEAHAWVDGFKQAFPDIPVSFVVSVAYDSANMLFNIIAGGTATDGESLRTALKAHPGHKGVSGTFKCDAEGNCLHQADIIKWEGTKMTMVDTIEMPPQ